MNWKRNVLVAMQDSLSEAYASGDYRHLETKHKAIKELKKEVRKEGIVDFLCVFIVICLLFIFL